MIRWRCCKVFFSGQRTTGPNTAVGNTADYFLEVLACCCFCCCRKRSKSQIGPIATGRKVGKVEEVVLSATAAAAAAASKPTMEIDRPIKGTHTLLLPLKPIDSNSRKCTLRALSTSSSHQNARDTEKERNGMERKGHTWLGEEEAVIKVACSQCCLLSFCVLNSRFHFSCPNCLSAIYNRISV